MTMFTLSNTQFLYRTNNSYIWVYILSSKNDIFLGGSVGKIKIYIQFTINTIHPSSILSLNLVLYKLKRKIIFLFDYLVGPRAGYGSVFTIVADPFGSVSFWSAGSGFGSR